MTEPERISKLLAILTFTLCWCIRTGELLSEYQPLKLKTHGRLEKSLFRYGFDRLRHIVLHFDSQIDAFLEVLKLLSVDSDGSSLDMQVMMS